RSKLSSLDKVDLLVICVPTPMNEDGSCDVSIVEEVIKKTKARLILIKSTVPPGTTANFAWDLDKDVVFSPEFAGESKYWSPYKFDTDMKEMPYYIFGGAPELTEEVVEFYMPVGGPTKQYLQTDSNTAEMVKYMENSYFAAKVTMCQEFYEICKVLEVDYNKARELWLHDPRINPMHTAVFPDNRGFGGKCFPKDINAMVKFSEKAGYNPELFKQILKSNKFFVNKNKK
nr:hypothetical protein [Nanoarchaeota archaeon]